MNSKEFEINIDDIFEQCKSMLIRKGREYQSTKDEGVNVFANFERSANDLGLNRESILWVYFSKHKDSITTFIRDMENGKTVEEHEKNLSEPISGRIIDAINYLLLLNAMITERKI